MKTFFKYSLAIALVFACGLCHGKIGKTTCAASKQWTGDLQPDQFCKLPSTNDQQTYANESKDCANIQKTGTDPNIGPASDTCTCQNGACRP